MKLTMASVDVSSPHGPWLVEGDAVAPWAMEQLSIADQILDNPGGGLVFASQTMGQVRATLTRVDSERWQEEIRLLLAAEDAAVHHEFDRAWGLLNQARAALGSREPPGG